MKQRIKPAVPSIRSQQLAADLFRYIETSRAQIRGTEGK
jgi:hypothetical protein